MSAFICQSHTEEKSIAVGARGRTVNDMRMITFIVLCAFLLAGCTSGRSVETTYPRIEYRNSSTSFDPYNRELNITAGYVLDEGHSYDVVETDTGFDIVFHFVKLEEDSE